MKTTLSQSLKFEVVGEASPMSTPVKTRMHTPEGKIQGKKSLRQFSADLHHFSGTYCAGRCGVVGSSVVFTAHKTKTYQAQVHFTTFRSKIRGVGFLLWYGQPVIRKQW